MVKKLLMICTALAVIGGAAAYWFVETSSAKLAEPVQVSEQMEDFIMHVQVEKNEEGFQVLRSLEYIGDEPIVLSHRTPLISLRVNHDTKNFTGSPVTKELNPGDVYHPQEAKVFNPLKKGSHTLYMDCEFYIDGERKNIKAHKEMVFQ
ncbi:hypothetical protein [Sediminibacillus halophilus]|uniref:Uncharacterized protein n=1 Tax=Sediminibacillus halophilus TaxID=482461 RepID=A0A1G9N132_9BACI|nr:hypothetical protein [Sediminibacillus halophilus]SDL80064.1 hypothetical protein SAMN05216244_0803 [Sediminibacillus halophilus]